MLFVFRGRKIFKQIVEACGGDEGAARHYCEYIETRYPHEVIEKHPAYGQKTWLWCQEIRSLMSEDTWNASVRTSSMADVKDVTNLTQLMQRAPVSGNNLANGDAMLALSDIQMEPRKSESQGTSSSAASTIIDGMSKSSDAGEATTTPTRRTNHGDTELAPASTTEGGTLKAADKEECGGTATAPALTTEGVDETTAQDVVETTPPNQASTTENGHAKTAEDAEPSPQEKQKRRRRDTATTDETAATAGKGDTAPAPASTTEDGASITAQETAEVLALISASTTETVAETTDRNVAEPAAPTPASTTEKGHETTDENAEPRPPPQKKRKTKPNTRNTKN